MTPPNLEIAFLLDAYRRRQLTPRDVVRDVLSYIESVEDRRVWITRLTDLQVMSYVDALEANSMELLPLYGIPFVIKDNIDLAGTPTTAGCPAFAYTPDRSATVVQRLIDAGAIPLGKTNLDQFATGLVGARSPYGECRNSFHADYVSGGSSSGSAVAVATGLASFSLGTDTAGSGRIPAAFNNIVGLKPSNGRLSTRGVVPACRSIDCVSIFALTADDAARVLEAAQGFDAEDPYSRRIEDLPPRGCRVGIPRADQLEFFGDTEYARLFDAAAAKILELGGEPVEIDFAPFLAAARLLYDGPWIAERFAAVGSFIEAHRSEVHPITAAIIETGREVTAVSAFTAGYRLKALYREAEAAWSQVDVIMTPTAGTIFRRDALAKEPVLLNSRLGLYTNFMNLFDLCGVAMPAGFRSDGLPFGITLVGPRASDRELLALAARWHRTAVRTLGALPLPLRSQAAPLPQLRPGFIPLAVCGAHMQGLPLNHQLRDRHGYLLKLTRTAPRYRLFALPGGPPHRPGLVREHSDGVAVEVEVWALPAGEVGGFIVGIPAPLGIGKVELDSGECVNGFICEGYATADATDISALGSWRRYVGVPSPSGDP